MYVLGAAYFLTPLLGAGVYAGIEVRVVEDDGVGVAHVSDGRAAAVGQDAAEHLLVPVEPLYRRLWGHGPRALQNPGADTTFLVLRIRHPFTLLFEKAHAVVLRFIVSYVSILLWSKSGLVDMKNINSYFDNTGMVSVLFQAKISSFFWFQLLK